MTLSAPFATLHPPDAPLGISFLPRGKQHKADVTSVDSPTWRRGPPPAGGPSAVGIDPLGPSHPDLPSRRCRCDGYGDVDDHPLSQTGSTGARRGLVSTSIVWRAPFFRRQLRWQSTNNHIRTHGHDHLSPLPPHTTDTHHQLSLRSLFASTTSSPQSSHEIPPPPPRLPRRPRPRSPPGGTSRPSSRPGRSRPRAPGARGTPFPHLNLLDNSHRNIRPNPGSRSPLGPAAASSLVAAHQRRNLHLRRHLLRPRPRGLPG
jgi:hypothetical protein